MKIKLGFTALLLALLCFTAHQKAEAGWGKKPGWAKKAQQGAQRGFDSAKKSVKGHCVISVYNASDERISIWSSTGNESIKIEPRKTGKLNKTDIGSETTIEVDSAASATQRWRSGLVVQNRIDLVFNGRDLKRN